MVELGRLVVSAVDLRQWFPDWPEAMIEDYLNILDDLVRLASDVDENTEGLAAHIAMVLIHIDWTNATQNLFTTGDGAFGGNGTFGGDLFAVGDIDGATGHFGTAPDFSEFEPDGTLKFNGAATVVLDEFGELLGKRLESPSSRIVENIAEGSLTFKNNAALADYVNINTQINHDWQLGSNLRPHVHWWQVSANTPNWLMEFRWQRNGEAKNTVWTRVAWAVNVFTYTAGDLNQITGFPSITPPAGYGLSDIVQQRLFRDNANASGLFAGADPEASDVDATSFDIHKDVDTVGSRTPFSK
jgi:hypothetical protein